MQRTPFDPSGVLFAARVLVAIVPGGIVSPPVVPPLRVRTTHYSRLEYPSLFRCGSRFDGANYLGDKSTRQFV